MTHRRFELPVSRRPWWARVFTWANGLRLMGAGGFVFLLLDSGTEKPTYMIACLGLMGLPNVISVDRKKDR